MIQEADISADRVHLNFDAEKLQPGCDRTLRHPSPCIHCTACDASIIAQSLIGGNPVSLGHNWSRPAVRKRAGVGAGSCHEATPRTWGMLSASLPRPRLGEGIG